MDATFLCLINTSLVMGPLMSSFTPLLSLKKADLQPLINDWKGRNLGHNMTWKRSAE